MGPLACAILVVFVCGCNAYLAIELDKSQIKLRRMKLAHRLEITYYKQMLRK